MWLSPPRFACLSVLARWRGVCAAPAPLRCAACGYLPTYVVRERERVGWIMRLATRAPPPLLSLATGCRLSLLPSISIISSPRFFFFFSIHRSIDPSISLAGHRTNIYIQELPLGSYTRLPPCVCVRACVHCSRNRWLVLAVPLQSTMYIVLVQGTSRATVFCLL